MPLHFVSIRLREGQISTEDLATAVAEAPFGPETTEAVQEWTGPITAVVCTRDRPTELRRCLAGLLELSEPDLEILIIDNAPRDNASKLAFQDVVGDSSRFHYVLEPKPGLSRARNRALEVARGDVVAFTDDDVRVDPHWISGLRLGFGRAPDVGCVTGLVATASMTTRAEQYFDARVWWSSSCSRRIFREARGPADPVIHPFSAGQFGTGANMAVRRDLMLALGGFDEAFGAGGPTGGSEDLDAFVRILRSGYALSYEPSALVWHEHRATDEALRAQMYSYGRGLSAYVTKYLTQRDTIGPVLGRAPHAVWHLVTLQKRSDAAADAAKLPSDVKQAELRGFLVGPLAYLKARIQAGKPPLPRLRSSLHSQGSAAGASYRRSHSAKASGDRR